MQGSYNNNGLPRPYYMKPSKKKQSPYTNLKEPIVFFTNSRRKLGGYIIMLLLFGTLMWWVSQDLRPKPEPDYEIVTPDSQSANKVPLKDNSNVNIDKLINDAVGSRADKEFENKDLAGNLAKGSHGEKGLGVAEAPKGGVANEAVIVGSDEDKLIGTGKGNKKNQQVLDGKPPIKGYQADISNDAATAVVKPPNPGGAAAAAGAAAGIAQPVKPADREQDEIDEILANAKTPPKIPKKDAKQVLL